MTAISVLNCRSWSSSCSWKRVGMPDAVLAFEVRDAGVALGAAD